MAIDVGAAAIDRPSSNSSGYTYLALDNPANDTGTIDTVEVWAASSMTGMKVGTEFLVSGTTYECRDVESIGSVTSGSKQTYSGLSLSVSTDDLIGGYFATGTIEVTGSGFSGLRDNYNGNRGDALNIGEQDNFSYLWSGDAASLYGTGTEAGGGLAIPIVMRHRKQMGVS